MKRILIRGAAVGLLAATVVARAGSPALGGKALADDKLPVLKVGSVTYSNVTITSTTATDIYFSHATGMGNAKLKKLSPDLQKHFHYDAAKAGEAEKSQHAATAQYRLSILSTKPATNAAAAGTMQTSRVVDDGREDPAAPEIYAKSFLGQNPPQIIVDEWLTPPPELEGKFVLVYFWTTYSPSSRDSIPGLNAFYGKYKDRLAMMALSNESLDDLRKMTSPHFDFPEGTDTQARTMMSAEMKAVPHILLMDPKGIVRYEGPPDYLDERGLSRLLARYSD